MGERTHASDRDQAYIYRRNALCEKRDQSRGLRTTKISGGRLLLRRLKIGTCDHVDDDSGTDGLKIRTDSSLGFSGIPVIQ